jgi:carbamoyl-phosphate synthase large subunit
MLEGRIFREYPRLTVTVPHPILLLTSLSAKKSLYDYVLKDAHRFHPEARLIGADSNPACPGAQYVEEFITIPPISDLDPTGFCEFCIKHSISHVIPTRDGELAFLAEAGKILGQENIHVFVAPPEALSKCLDKLVFSERLAAARMPVIPAFSSIDELRDNQLVVKERHGSGSEQIGIDLTREAAESHAGKLENPIFQPYVGGREFSAEVWLDKRSRAHGAVLRWRKRVVSGESHQTVTFRNEEWEDLVVDCVEALGLTGHALAQVIVDENDSPHIVEINPRLGGASPLSLACGLHSIEWFLRETAGEVMSLGSTFKPSPGKSLTREGDQVTIEL